MDARTPIEMQHDLAARSGVLRARSVVVFIAKAAFGPEVVAHYRNMARVELDAYDSAVTDWELRRSFERL